MQISEWSPAVNIERVWAGFLEARERAQRTGRIEHGIQAGKAWAEFLALFVADAPSIAPRGRP
jgi:hypothetical protein